MKYAFALLLMSTTLGAGFVGLAAGQSVARAPDPARLRLDAASAATLTLVDDNEDEAGAWFQSLSGDDEAGDDEAGDDEAGDDCARDDDGNICATQTANTPAKAGTVAPPNNGLFTNGTAPVVKSN